MILRKISKKLWLPMKYLITERKIINNTDLRPVKEVYNKIKIEQSDLVKAQCKEDEEAIIKQKAKLEILKWLTYDTKGKTK